MLIYVHRTKMPSARLTVDYDKRWDMWDKAYGMFFLLALCHHNSFPPFLSHHWHLLSTHHA
jgi:hypothetical protein